LSTPTPPQTGVQAPTPTAAAKKEEAKTNKKMGTEGGPPPSILPAITTTPEERQGAAAMLMARAKAAEGEVEQSIYQKLAAVALDEEAMAMFQSSPQVAEGF